ncbi:MAG: hypothetical protein ACKVS9_12140 [Phycisphaerae bacterium]
MASTRSRTRRLTTLLATAACVSVPAQAIDIQLVFDAAGSATYSVSGQDRTLDIIPIFEAAAARWEDVLEDNHTITITYRWEEAGAPEACITAVDMFNRPTTATIRIRADVTWFMDPDPYDDDEFDMQPKLYRDMHPVEQPEAFGGAVPEVFEVGYNGAELANLSPDLLSIVLHEMGHAIGLVYHDNPPCGAQNTQCNTDHDYDLNVNWVGGAAMNIRALNNGGGSFDCAHLAAGGIQACNDDPECEAYQALMWSGPLPNRRQLPGATDIFAVALRSGYSDIDLPRKYWLGTAQFWNTTTRWLGGAVPDAGDDVYFVVQNGISSASISNADAFARNLIIDEGNAVGVFNTRRLLVGDDIDILDGTLTVGSADALVRADRVNIAAASDVVGSGTVQLFDYLINAGRLRGSGGELRIDGLNASVMVELDGFPDAPFAGVDAVAGDVTITADWWDLNFDGVIEVGSGRTFTFDDQLNMGGNVTLTGTPSAATIDGPTVLRANVFVDGEGRFENTTTLDSQWIQVPTVDDELVLAGVTNYQGGFFTGDGVLTQTGNAFIQDDVSIDTATYDWDGEIGNSVCTVLAGNTLTINSNKIENSVFVDGFDGTLNVLGATVDVNTSTAWRLDGTIFMNIPAGALSVIDGENMDVQGLVQVDATGRFDAEVDILAGGEVRTFDAASVAIFNSTADNTITQGSITGPGTLQVPAGRHLYGTGSIAARINSGGEIRADGGSLVCSGAIDAIGTIGTNNVTAVLNVVNAWSTGASGELNLRGGSVIGGNITAAGRISGSGIVNVPSVSLSGLLLPGDPVGIGTLTFAGDMLMSATATTVIQINGPQQGITHDFVRIFGDLQAGGLLRVIKSGAYNPACGTELQVISHTGLLNDGFDTYSGLDLGNGLRFFVDYSAAAITLRVVPQGDLDGDGDVDLSNLSTLLANFGTLSGASPEMGDLDQDSDVDLSDLAALLAQFGTICP